MLHWGWIGQLSSSLLSGGLFGALSLGFIGFRGFISLDIDRRYLRDALAFGLPLIPHALSGWFLTGVDRFLITSILGNSSTGVYAVGYQFGLVIGVLAASFNKAWVPYLYNRLGTIDHVGKLRIVKFTYVYFLGILSLALLLAAVSPWVIKNILGKAFSGSAQFVLWVSLGYAFEGMYYMVVNQIFFVKKTHWLATVTFSVSVLHIAVSYLCIRHFGVIGAAYATTMSFGITFVIVWILSARVYPMPWLFWGRA
jgi:O-antigen/teichoic acid export membrane protein